MLREQLVVRAPRLAHALQRLRRQTLGAVTREIEDNRVLLGQVMARQLPTKVDSLVAAEFKVFSQLGEDGIIQYLLGVLGELPHSFIEFGVETYRESNTRFLLRNNTWRGLVIDGSPHNVAAIKRLPEYWQYDLTACASFITRDNINHLFADAGFTGEVGLLSIDIDGNDYWVWEAIEVVSPVVVVVEYNSVFGSEAAVSVPYSATFSRREAHYSNLYFGASLPALSHLATRKGYALIGCNSGGTNAFFVRTDRLGSLEPTAVADCFVDTPIRQSRDARGNLTFLSGRRRLEEIWHLPVSDVTTGSVQPLREFVS